MMRIICREYTLVAEDMRIYNIYGPNNDNVQFFQSQGQWVSTSPLQNKIVEEDFNSVLNKDETRR